MFFTITMRFSTFRDSFCGESIMFLEINLVHNSLNNVIKNLVKIFSLKQTNQILSPALGKIKFCLFKNTASHSFRL